MKNAVINRRVISKIATALAELNEQVVYVGGAVVGLYINDSAADDVRPTKDIDISLSIATIVELEEVREDLIKKGFTQTAEDDVICRFRFEDIKVDFMNTISVGWVPANPWFAGGFSLRETVEIEDKQIQILPIFYFLASKFAAYEDRGKKDPRTSHDFEDIVYILDNRTDMVQQILNAPEDVKPFLKTMFEKILKDRIMQEAILSNLYYETRDYRFAKIMGKLEEVVGNV